MPSNRTWFDGLFYKGIIPVSPEALLQTAVIAESQTGVSSAFTSEEFDEYVMKTYARYPITLEQDVRFGMQQDANI